VAASVLSVTSSYDTRPERRTLGEGSATIELASEKRDVGARATGLLHPGLGHCPEIPDTTSSVQAYAIERLPRAGGGSVSALPTAR
jgi:hypothetical protein